MSMYLQRRSNALNSTGLRLGGKDSDSGISPWVTAVKRAFGKNCTCKRRNHLEDEEDKKRESRRRWLLFRKHSTAAFRVAEREEAATTHCIAPKSPVLPAGQRHAIAVAVEIIQLRQPTNDAAVFKRQSSARVIQTAFRGYMARRALVALKGIVKLQAVIRGQNVRMQALSTMKCIEALLWVQACQTRNNGRRWYMDAEASNLWESKHLKDLRNGKSRSRNRSSSSIPDDWQAAMTQRASANPKQESTKDQRSAHRSQIHGRAVVGRRPRSPQVHAVAHANVNAPSLRLNRCNKSRNSDGAMPNYMAPTESARARIIHSQSVPRQRPSAPDRERGRSGKKHLSNPAPNPDCLNFRSRYNGLSQKPRSPNRHISMEKRLSHSMVSEWI